jgi:hypothetical protein
MLRIASEDERASLARGPENLRKPDIAGADPRQ